MSDFLDLADSIKTRLQTAAATGERATEIDLTDIEVIVDRQKDLVTSLAKAMAKSGGTAIIILWQGFQPDDETSGSPRLVSRYTISATCKPIRKPSDLNADDVMQSIIQRLWRWVPGGGHCFGAAKGFRGGLIPDTKYLVYDCEVSFPILL